MREYFIRKNGEPYIDNQLRVRFNVQVFPSSVLSLAEINIYNLANGSEIKHGDSIELIAGYKNRSGLIFKGTVINTFRERDNADILTRVIARTNVVNDRGSANSAYGEGANIVDVLADLAKAWPLRLDIDVKQFENAPPLQSGMSLDGDIPTILNSLAREYDFQWVEHVGRLIIMKQGEIREDVTAVKISQMTGMEGIPEVNLGPYGLGVTVMKRLDPFIFPNSIIEIETGFNSFNTGNIYFGEVQPDLSANGVYNVLSLIHKGDTHGDEWTSEFQGLRKDMIDGISEIDGISHDGDTLIWGKKVSQAFRAKVREIAGRLRTDPNFLMAVMSAETGATFDPAIRNPHPNSTATGLIQFIESTARGLGTTTAQLARMSAVEQLEYVYKYYRPFTGKLNKLSDVYVATMYPAYVGKPRDFVAFRKPSKEYDQNASLDKDKKGYITIADIAFRVETWYKKGTKQAG